MAAKKGKVKKDKTCFLISPIGEPASSTRVRADFLMEMIVRPVLENQFNYKVERSDGNYQPGTIDDQIFDSISNFDLIIANLTELNANVFYELGIAHSMGRPVIQMAETGVKVPFDTATNRVNFYNIKNVQGFKDAQTALAKVVKAVEANDYSVENPFTRYRGRSAKLAKATPFEKQMLTLAKTLPSILARLERLEAPPPGIDFLKIGTSSVLGSGTRRYSQIDNEIDNPLLLALLKAQDDAAAARLLSDLLSDPNALSKRADTNREQLLAEALRQSGNNEQTKRKDDSSGGDDDDKED